MANEEAKLEPLTCTFSLTKMIIPSGTWAVQVTPKGKRKAAMTLIGDSPAQAFQAVAAWIDSGAPTIADIKASGDE